MRRIVAQFLLIRFAAIFLFVVFALTSLLVLFDLLAHADDLAVHHQSTFLPMAWYAGLRLPVLFTMITPMSALLAALVTFERLATQYELTALQSAGVSLYQVCAVLLAGGLAISAMHFGVAVALATPAEGRLFRWAERNYEGLPERSVLEPGTAWFATGNYRVRIGNARDNGRQLDDVVVIGTGQPGALTSYCEAKEARFSTAGWTLFDGWQQDVEGGPREVFTRRALDVPLAPDQVVQVRLPVSSLDLATLRALAGKPAEARPLPARHYQTGRGRRIAEPLGSLVMILLSAPLGLQLKRSGRQAFWGSVAIGLGFLFFITERILLAFGQSGALGPDLAVWSPLAVFGIGSVATLIHLQK